jgi:hypothetical protein
MVFTYPNSELDQPRRVHALLGGLWSTIYQGRDFLRLRTSARCADARQNLRDLETAAACVARHQVPLYRRTQWHLLELHQSDMQHTEAALWRWDDPELVFNGERLFRFDEPLQNTYRFPVPDQLADCTLISDRLGTPTLSWHRGLDFQLTADRSAVLFRADPFQDDRLLPEPVFAGGVVTDYRLRLWLFRPTFDREYVYQHVGYILGMRGRTSAAYKRVLNATLDAITGGTAREQVGNLLSAACDIPLVQTRQEIVEDIYRDDYLWILTDQRTYRFAAAAEPAVAVGATLQYGQSLITGFQELRMWKPLPADLPAVVLHRGMLGADFLGDLVFSNRIVALEVSGSPPQVRFAIGGFPADVERFWELVHARRLIYGQSLYELLSAQTSPLPLTINPAQFAAQNLLRNNYLLYWLQADQFGPDTFELGTIDLLRKIVPPHQAVLVFLELTSPTQSVTMAAVDDSGLDTYEPLITAGAIIGAAAVVDGLPDPPRIVRFTCH